MSTPCQAASPNLQKLDPLKRVNYTFGLVLGVEEFVQSDTYFLAKHHLENRLLHGYGTCCGLDVIAQTTPTLEVQVTPGWAINPRGQEIKVPQLMCVQIGNWIQANLSDLQNWFPSAPYSLGLCVVLCYRECKTAVVPIPGQPCTTQSSSTAPSRIADSFELMLCLDDTTSPLSSPITSPLSSPPAGTPGGLCVFRPTLLEDDAIHALAELLSEFKIATISESVLTIDDVEQLVRDLKQPIGSPPVGSPPAGPPYFIDAADAPRFLRAALRTWITEVRPFVSAASGVGPCCPPPEKCVLLAQLTVELNQPGWIAVGLTVDDSHRPFIVPTKLLEEMIFVGSAALGGGS